MEPDKKPRQLATMPHSTEAEKTLLGALLLNGALFSETVEKGLSADDFWEPRHQIIYKAMQKINNEQRLPELVTVNDQLSKEGQSDLIGGILYLTELMDEARFTREGTLQQHAELILDKSLYRQLIKTCETNTTLAYRQEGSFDTIVNALTNDLIKLSLERSSNTLQSLDSALNKELGSLKARIEHGNPLQGLTSGFFELDELSTGFKPGEVIIVAGRPGMGKTSIALNMALAMARAEKKVLFFTIEMPTEQLVRRIISQECMINAKNLTTGKLEQDELAGLWRNMDSIADLPFYIDETSHLTLPEIRAKAKKAFKEMKGLDAIFIDYLQLMSDETSDDRVQEISKISRGLKVFAKDMGVPVIALAQLNRRVEMRSGGDGVPLLSDLRDSGAIEQDADVVMFIHRDMNKEAKEKDVATLYVRKNRNGQTGEVKLRFIGHFTKFLPYERGGEEAY